MEPVVAGFGEVISNEFSRVDGDGLVDLLDRVKRPLRLSCFVWLSRFVWRDDS